MRWPPRDRFDLPDLPELLVPPARRNSPQQTVSAEVPDSSGPGPLAREAVAIRRIAVIGAGLLGRKLAELCCSAGYSIVLEDVLPSRLRGTARAFENLSEKCGTGQVEYALTIEEAVRDADLVIDCVPDELESKLEILSLIDRMAPPRTIIATPTRALSIADLASCTYRPERCLGLRLPLQLLDSQTLGDGDNPASVHITQVAITRIGGTDPAVLEAVVAFWQSVGFESTIALDS
jgi:3-hydroxybutyryl-CoA dehydrogenase